MLKGDVLGHENMGEVVEVGKDVKNLKVGDRIITPFIIACGECFFCRKELFSSCDRSNPNAEMARDAMGQTHAHRYLEPLFKKIVDGEINPSFVITLRVSFDEVAGSI